MYVVFVRHFVLRHREKWEVHVFYARARLTPGNAFHRANAVLHLVWRNEHISPCIEFVHKFPREWQTNPLDLIASPINVSVTVFVALSRRVIVCFFSRDSFQFSIFVLAACSCLQCTWLCVLWPLWFIQFFLNAVVHIKVAYMKNGWFQRQKWIGMQGNGNRAPD